jgi:tripartite-type tricarboxylate transporter receptor subunit TctC
MAGSHYVNANRGYDLQRDFTPISLIETVPWAFIANPALPVKTVREFIAYAKARPGKLSYGTIGVGQIPGACACSTRWPASRRWKSPTSRSPTPSST